MIDDLMITDKPKKISYEKQIIYFIHEALMCNIAFFILLIGVALLIYGTPISKESFVNMIVAHMGVALIMGLSINNNPINNTKNLCERHVKVAVFEEITLLIVMVEIFIVTMIFNL